jgi:FkbH-like protein
LESLTLQEALGIINVHRQEAARRRISLVCGFEPLHLSTFLQARAMQRFPGERVEVSTGIYDDLAGNIARAKANNSGAVAIVVEWQDLDPRLGVRAAGGWSSAVQRDIEKTVAARFEQFAAAIQDVAAESPVVLAGPALPLPPLGHTVPQQSSRFELHLQQEAAAFLYQMSEIPGVRVAHPRTTPLNERLDAKMALLAGFPYSLRFADDLASVIVDLLYPAGAKKGLIVDLDDTLWRGILGEAGVDGVSWHQEHHSQVHALLQQMLGQLAENGVLLAIASKNDAALVQQALQRPDLLLPADAFFPVVANWDRKSVAVGQILEAWNVLPDSVVFVDDNPMELSEVQSVYPAVTGLRFTPQDPAAVWTLLNTLRELFGKAEVHAEDKLRASSIRAGAAVRIAARDAGSGKVGSSTEFLASLAGRVSIDYRQASADKRSLELINKTNQFNLNGIRITEGEWLEALRADTTIVAAGSYQDKFGPLGKIAVLLGKRQGDDILVTSWVMSCRAFSRRIEHHLLESLFQKFGVAGLQFDFRPTERNQPLQDFLREAGAQFPEQGLVRISRADFQGRHELPHEVTELS